MACITLELFFLRYKRKFNIELSNNFIYTLNRYTNGHNSTPAGADVARCVLLDLLWPHYWEHVCGYWEHVKQNKKLLLRGL